MHEVSKDEFREMYFRHAQPNDGWTQAYWDEFYAVDRVPPMRYFVEPPASPAHCRMMIADDYGTRQHRLFFFTDDSEESLFGGSDD